MLRCTINERKRLQNYCGFVGGDFQFAQNQSSDTSRKLETKIPAATESFERQS